MNANSTSQANTLPFGESTVLKNDCFLQELLRPYEHDSLVDTIFSVVLSAFAKTCKRVFVDHLPGGKHFERDSAKYDETISTPKHNKFPESVFAFADHLMTTKPSISVIACEAYIMFAQNKTMEWLERKSDKEMDILMAQARKETKTVKKIFHERDKEIQLARHEAVLAKIACTVTKIHQ